MKEHKSFINHHHKTDCVFDCWHNHFGAYFTVDGDIVFKIFTFQEVKTVYLEVKPEGKPIQKFTMEHFGLGIW